MLGKKLDLAFDFVLLGIINNYNKIIFICKYPTPLEAADAFHYYPQIYNWTKEGNSLYYKLKIAKSASCF